MVYLHLGKVDTLQENINLCSKPDASRAYFYNAF